MYVEEPTHSDGETEGNRNFHFSLVSITELSKLRVVNEMFMLQNFLMCLKIMLLILKMLKDHKNKQQNLSHSGLELKGQVAQRSSGSLGLRCLTLAWCVPVFTVAFF